MDEKFSWGSLRDSLISKNIPLPQFIFVVGTTASGKSDLAIEWAQKFNAQILNCDSLQVYSDLNIGTAKPSQKDFSLVSHHLFNLISYPKEMTAGEYLRYFYQHIKEDLFNSSERKIYFVVGGTGFYFQAIEKGLYPVPKIPVQIKEQIEKEMTTEAGATALFSELKLKDPLYALQVHPHDLYRLGRALEIIRALGKTVSEVQQEFKSQSEPFPFPVLKCGLWLESATLNQRILARSQAMVEQGLIEETQNLLKKTDGHPWSPLESVGYRETIQFLTENKTRSWLVEAVSLSTRQLAKKQKTWFQRDKNIFWIKSNEDKVKFEFQLIDWLNQKA